MTSINDVFSPPTKEFRKGLFVKHSKKGSGIIGEDETADIGDIEENKVTKMLKKQASAVTHRPSFSDLTTTENIKKTKRHHKKLKLGQTNSKDERLKAHNQASALASPSIKLHKEGRSPRVLPKERPQLVISLMQEGLGSADNHSHPKLSEQPHFKSQKPSNLSIQTPSRTELPSPTNISSSKLKVSGKKSRKLSRQSSDCPSSNDQTLKAEKTGHRPSLKAIFELGQNPTDHPEVPEVTKEDSVSPEKKSPPKKSENDTTIVLGDNSILNCVGPGALNLSLSICEDDVLKDFCK